MCWLFSLFWSRPSCFHSAYAGATDRLKIYCVHEPAQANFTQEEDQKAAYPVGPAHAVRPSGNWLIYQKP